MSDNMKNIKDLMLNNSFTEMVNKVSSLQEIQVIIQSIINNDFQPYYRIANIKQNELIIETKNASIRLALLCEEKNIINALANHYSFINQITVKVNPTF